jgi:hypothetical protein
MPKDTSKEKDNKWKDKALSRQITIKSLKWEIKDLRESRQGWKERCLRAEAAAKECPSLGATLSESPPAKGHQYSLLLVMFCVRLYQYGGMSLRSCQHCLVCFSVIFGDRVRCPCANSIRNWLCKLGYYRCKCTALLKEDYLLWIDESIVIGGEKILLILGAPLSKLSKSKGIAHKDVSVLELSVGKQWKSTDITPLLADIKCRVGIKYIVSDRGHNLVKSFKSGSYTYISDCTHSFAKLLEKAYKKDADFIFFTQKCAEYRHQWNLHTDFSAYLPPKLRVKMRFANLFVLVDWAVNILNKWDSFTPDVQARLGFVKEQESLVRSLARIEGNIKSVQACVKAGGFAGSYSLTSSASATPKELAIYSGIKVYFDELEQSRLSLDLPSVVCHSDIIESIFGKFKQKKSGNPAQKMTEFVLTIATFTGVISKEEIKTALETVRMQDLKNYKKTPKKTTQKKQKVGEEISTV